MKPTKLFATLCIGGLFLASCGNGENKTTTTDTTVTASATPSADNSKALKPAGPKPDWAPDMHDEMAVVIEKLTSYNAPPIPTLTAQEARKQPTPTNAVMDVMKDKGIAMPAPQSDTMGKDIPGACHVRIYTPKNGNGPFPVIVYYHGGGWVIADNNTYMASAQALCEQVGAVVVSVEYPKGPEQKFPAAHNASFAAYQWVLKNAATIKGDPAKIAVVGESAGGNLACNMSIMARDKSIMMPLCQVLVYPVAANDTTTASFKKYMNAKPLSSTMMPWFLKNFLPDMSKGMDPRIALVKANLKGLPPTTIINAEIDPLHDDSDQLEAKLKEAGVTVDHKSYDGVTHEFFGMATVVPEAKDAQSYAVKQLKAAFNK